MKSHWPTWSLVSFGTFHPLILMVTVSVHITVTLYLFITDAFFSTGLCASSFLTHVPGKTDVKQSVCFTDMQEYEAITLNDREIEEAVFTRGNVEGTCHLGS